MKADKQRLLDSWLKEESIAHIRGWDFSHIDDRYCEEDDIPWDYKSEIEGRLKPDMRLMDIDTGGGEFLLSLHHPYANTSAMENYPPNVALCNDTLIPLGIDFRRGDGKGPYPFDDGVFEMVIDRHGDFNEEEIFRVLKPGGVFITQQVGAENDRELVDLLLPETSMPFPEQYLSLVQERFRKAGLTILKGAEHYGSIRFYDVGALVWFARIIEWEFPGFSVESCMDKLLEAEERIEDNGLIEGRTHRFFMMAVKE